MSQQVGVLDLTLKAGVNLSAKQYRLVKMSAANTVTICAANTDEIIGVLQNKPTTAQAAVVRVLGTTKVSCGTPVAVTFGSRVTTDANGQAIICDTDKLSVIGVMLEGPSTAVGDIQEMLLTIHMISK